MAKIQYNTKKLRVNTPPTPEELFSFSDANEIKDAVNFLYDNQPVAPDLSGLVKAQPFDENYAMQAGNIFVDGNVRGDSAAFQYVNLVEGVIVNKTDFTGQAPITGFAQLLPNELTFNDNDYNTGYNGDAVYGSGSLSLRINGKGKFTLSKLGASNNDVDIKVPDASGTLALKSDIPTLPNMSNFATLNGYNTFTGNNTFNGFTNLQGASFQGDVNVNSGKRTSLGGGVDVYQDLSIYAGVGKIGLRAAYMGENQTYSITIPAKSGTLALTNDIPTVPDLSSFVNKDESNTFSQTNTFSTVNITNLVDFQGYLGNIRLYAPAMYSQQTHSLELPATSGTLATMADIGDPNSKTNKVETLDVGQTTRTFRANINTGFFYGVSNDEYEGDVHAEINKSSINIGAEKRNASSGQLERGKKLGLTYYCDGFIFNQYSAPKNNQLRLAFPKFETSENTSAILSLPALISDATVTTLSDSNVAPTGRYSPGVKGEVRIVGGYRYECIDGGQWVRSAVETSW